MTEAMVPIDPGDEILDEESLNQDIEMQDTQEESEIAMTDGNPAKGDPVEDVSQDRLVIAIDFGTTFSSVAYAVIPKGKAASEVNIREVKCIGNYPGYQPRLDIPDIRQDVPTELWYDDGTHDLGSYGVARNPDEFHGTTAGEHPDSSSDDDDSESEQSQFEEDEGLVGRGSNSRIEPDRVRTTQYWGFGVQKKLSSFDIPRNQARSLTRFKLCLDTTNELTSDIRTDLDVILKHLMRKKMIRSKYDIYADFLFHLLSHAKEQLLLAEILQPGMMVQLALCVPAKWPINGCRILQAALEQAAHKVEIGVSSIHNLFMISEPEAAAECIFAEDIENYVLPGETVVVVDAGGGTVDTVTYNCTNTEPLRLSAEVVAPDSTLHGASFINERFAKRLEKALRDETYLFINGNTLKNIVQRQTIEFENKSKRNIDIYDRKTVSMPVRVEYLQENAAKGFYQNNVVFSRKTLKRLFSASLKGVEVVLDSQLELAGKAGHRVEKIVLTGGFGQSPSLKSHLEDYLSKKLYPEGRKPQLIVPRSPATTVARGAVLRTLNKTMGPSRITQCSYGFLISMPYEPDVCEAHRGTRCRINAADGERYVDQVIQWVILAEERVESMQVFKFPVFHTFPITRKYLLCSEQLWMSDLRHPQHYRKSHRFNKGAVQVGTIDVDMSFLKNEGRIVPKAPLASSIHHGTQKKFWEVHYEVVLIVEGRSIRFEARHPVQAELEEGEHQKILAMKLVGIAAAFQPGTA